MNYLKSFFLLLISMLMLIGCDDDLFTQIVQIDIPEHQSGISIGADFTQFDNNVVRLRASKGIQENGDLENITGATVTLKRGNQIIKIFEDQSISGMNPPGFYINAEDLTLEPDKEYTIEVEKDGFSTATASQVMPVRVEVSNLEYNAEAIIDRDGDKADQVSVTFTDPAGRENYYAVKAFVLYNNGRTDEIFVRNNIDPLIEEGFNQSVVIADGAFDGRTVTFNLNLGRTFKDDAEAEQIEINFFNITKDKYLFERSLRIYEDSEFNPFVEPVIVHENVNGGHGLFSISHVEKYSIEID